jgi:hypothetical protein
MPTSEACRQSCREFERHFTLPLGGVDLLALYDALRDKPEQLALYRQASREMRAERKAS